MNSAMRELFFALALVLAACSPELRIPGDAVITCADDSACPAGFVCAGVRCVAPELLDAAGPALIVPADRELVRARSAVPFAWGLVTGAASYTLTIASDASSTNVVQRVIAIADSQIAVTLEQEGTYYWSVSSDVTVPGLEQTRIFGVIDAAVYVACDDDCTVQADVIELGTRANPFRSVGRGVAASAAVGAGEVHVASRAGGAPYTESFALPERTTLLGGYTRDFASRAEQTLLTSSGVILDAFAIREPTLVDGFILRSAGTQQSTVVRMALDSEALAFTNVTFDAPRLLTPLVTVVSGADTLGPRLARCLITAAASVELSSTVVSLSGHGALQLDNTSITASAAGASDGTFPPVLTGIDVDTSTLTMRASSLSLQSSGAIIGVRARGPGTDETSSGVASGSGAWFDGFNAHGVYAGNTVVVVSSNGLRGAIALSTGAKTRFANNLVVAGAVAAGYPALSEPGDGQFLALLANAFVGFSCQYQKPNAGGCTTIDNAGAGYEYTPAVRANIFPASLGAVGLAGLLGADLLLGTADDDYHPSPALAAQGVDPTSDPCTPPRPSDPGAQLAYNDLLRGLSSPTCGGATQDRDSVQRPTPPAIAAYEPR